VPGLTRAAVPILAAAGVRALSVGVNGGSAPPGVPKNAPFVWRDATSGAEVLAFWHPGGYGGGYKGADVGSAADCVQAPGFDRVLCYAWRCDNTGNARLFLWACVCVHALERSRWFMCLL
jgi:hypothetical protein